MTAIANSGIGRFLSAWWFAAWGFDWIYDKLFVKPYLAISHILRKDPLDQTIGLVPRMAKGGHTALSRTETVNCVGMPPRWLLVPRWSLAPSCW